MKALVYTAPQMLELQETAKPEGACVVRVLGCAICGTDLKTFVSGHHYFKPPAILGHEFIGRVEKAPAGGSFAEGDYVVAAPYGGCGHCAACSHGHGEMCKQKGYVSTGAFAEYVEVPSDFVERGMIRIAEPDMAYTLVEPLACALCALEQLKFFPDSRALVVGGGPMGALLALAMQSMGHEAAIVEVNPARREYLEGWGIPALSGPEDGVGYRDNILIAVNKPELVPVYMDMLADNGTLHIFSGMPAGARLDVDAHAIHYREVTLTGSTGFSLPQFQRAFQMIDADRQHFRRLITHQFALEDGLEAFRLFQSGKAFKVVLTP